MAKLNSDDYKDDPEYVAKKKEQIIEAYKVLTGSVPPAAKEQGKARFEKFKDYIEKDQDGEKKRIGSYQPFGRKRYTPDKKLGFAITIIAVAVIVQQANLRGILISKAIMSVILLPMKTMMIMTALICLSIHMTQTILLMGRQK